MRDFDVAFCWKRDGEFGNAVVVDLGVRFGSSMEDTGSSIYLGGRCDLSGLSKEEDSNGVLDAGEIQVGKVEVEE